MAKEMKSNEESRDFQYNFMQVGAKNQITFNPSLSQNDRGWRLHRPSYFDHGPGIPRVGTWPPLHTLREPYAIMNVDQRPLGLPALQA